MTSAAASATGSAEASPTTVQSVRETIESIVVAFILAFLFRAFVAEAFVIPTGSMAPTLMGAHKDIVCSHCGQQYQAGASSEFDADSGSHTDVATIGSTCSVCRGVNAYDLRDEPNHRSFSGDRILVSKFDYVLHKPERWDVFVFKYFEKARMNYIKRLVGLPGEQLLIREGDVYVKSKESPEWSIARKPPHKIKAMRQIVSDTDHQPPALIEMGWPSLWQPLDEAAGAWTLTHTPAEWSATLDSSETPQWLRYYHNFVPETDWIEWFAGQALEMPEPKRARLITDYLSYNSSFMISRRALYDATGRLEAEVTADNRGLELAVQQAQERLARRGDDMSGLNDALDEVLRPGIRALDPRDDGQGNDGLHWVGDLVGEFEVDVNSDSGLLMLDLVEFGIHFRCAIDVSNGNATLSAVDQDGAAIALFEGAEQLSASSGVRGAGSYHLEFANVDDQLVLWVDGSVVDFDQPAVFDSHALRNDRARRPYWTATDPLDAAPVAIGGQAIAMDVTRASVHRDIYYIAIRPDHYSDYNLQASGALRAEVQDAELRGRLTGTQAISEIYAHPEWWSQSDLFSLRGELLFDLDEGHYFPMGDNSAASSDARAWNGHHFIEEKFLLGKALLVFWPHTWNSPVPFTPNFARMGLIR